MQPQDVKSQKDQIPQKPLMTIDPKKKTGRAASERSVVRDLVFDLTDPEYVEKGKLAGQQRRALVVIEDQLEGAKKQAKLDTERAESALNLTLHVLASGKEARSVECIERKDFGLGKVEYYFDGVCMEERPLEPHERQQEMAI